MAENKLPNFLSVDQIVDFFDTHDMGEYSDDLPEADFDIIIKKKTYLIEIDNRLMKKISKLAKNYHLRRGTLVNNWLEEMAHKTQLTKAVEQSAG